jgi:uncharacterized membrane protein
MVLSRKVIIVVLLIIAIIIILAVFGITNFGSLLEVVGSGENSIGVPPQTGAS